MKKRIGFTLVEMLVVLFILAALVGMLMPVFQRVKRNVEIRHSLFKLQQIYLAISLYRQDYGGEGFIRYDSWNAYYSLGLMPLRYYEEYRLDQYIPNSAEFLLSPCGADKDIFESFRCGPKGWISYVAPQYEPRLMRPGSGNLADFKDYLVTYRENAVLFIDPYCNPSGTQMGAPYLYKRGLAVLLSGQLVNKYDMGNATASNLFWYSKPPE